MKEMDAKDRIIIPLDVSSLAKAKSLIEMLKPYVGCFKVGLELLTAVGAPKVVKFVHTLGGQVFFDGKFMDIPNTIAGASKAVAEMGVKMFNVHCLGGRKMMEAARQAAKEVSQREGCERPSILGVTLLTSLGFQDLIDMGICHELNIHNPVEAAAAERKCIELLVVTHLAWLAHESGLDGVVASPQEIEPLRRYLGSEFLIVTPGIRPAWAQANDQKRVMTPYEAIKAGADYLVIGRPITAPPEVIGTPVDAAKRITEEIKVALAA